MINVVHILEDFSFLSGGLRTVVYDLHSKLIENKINSKIITTRKEKNDDVILVKGGQSPWRFSSNLILELKKLQQNNKVNIIHIHGVWMYPQYIAAKFAYKNQIPFIITCHGMYEPWLWLKGKFRKENYFKYVTKQIFSKANYIHAITTPEAKELKKLFPNNKIKTIPNLIDFKDEKVYDSNLNEKYILYLGRIDKKKGIDILLKAFARLKENSFSLKIAGGNNDYKEELLTLAKELNIESKIEFLGLVVGNEKEKLFRNAYAFVAPSHSEVIGMVNLEAASMQTPVVTTYQTGLDKNWSKNGGFLINPNEDELFVELEKILNWSVSERNLNGKKLNLFVKENYSWNIRIKDWKDLYNSI